MLPTLPNVASQPPLLPSRESQKIISLCWLLVTSEPCVKPNAVHCTVQGVTTWEAAFWHKILNLKNAVVLIFGDKCTSLGFLWQEYHVFYCYIQHMIYTGCCRRSVTWAGGQVDASRAAEQTKAERKLPTTCFYPYDLLNRDDFSYKRGVGLMQHEEEHKRSRRK